MGPRQWKKFCAVFKRGLGKSLPAARIMPFGLWEVTLPLCQREQKENGPNPKQIASIRVNYTENPISNFF